MRDRSGRSSCFNCIIETFQTRANNLARRMLDGWALDEDVVQESLVSAYWAFHSYRGDNLKAWLMRIVANTCRDILRARRSRLASSPDPLPVDSENPDRTPSAADLPSARSHPRRMPSAGS